MNTHENLNSAKTHLIAQLENESTISNNNDKNK